jgi:radical SAM protein with 4Fe4S-binding SPASM domain
VPLKSESGQIINTIEQAWNSEPFDRFRAILKTACPNCDKKTYCMGGCPLMPQVVLCSNKHS